MRIQGTQYKIGDCVLLRFNGEIPIFGKVLGIVMKSEKHAVFATETLQTVCYADHFHAYQVATCLTKTYTCTTQSDLVDHHVLSIYQPHNSPSTFLIPLKYYVLDDFDLKRD